MENIIPKHIEPLTVKLRELGADVDMHDDSVVIKSKIPYESVNIKTLVYPGFATDLQQPITPLLFLSEGPSFVTDTIYPERFKHVDELQKWVEIFTSIKELQQSNLLNCMVHLYMQ